MTDVVHRLIVSACLAGRSCRYDGQDRARSDIVRLVARGDAVAVCPEESGGLGTPRDPADLTGGDGGAVLDGRARVVTASGRDVTAEFLAGASAALAAARAAGARRAVLTARSPSCGVGRVWCDGRLVSGHGVTAALLAREGIEVSARE